MYLNASEFVPRQVGDLIRTSGETGELHIVGDDNLTASTADQIHLKSVGTGADSRTKRRESVLHAVGRIATVSYDLWKQSKNPCLISNTLWRAAVNGIHPCPTVPIR